MSAYNGEKYIEEQLKSLLAQAYPHIEIYVRDDGSTDGTAAILKEYEARGQITFLQGENIGFCASFFALLAAAEQGDYWSFCDQDDIWFPGKVGAAIDWLNAQNGDGPLLYHSAFEMVDAEGNPLGKFAPPPYPFDFRTCMTGTLFLGFSTVINRPLRDAMLRCDPRECDAHDWLAGTVALAFGRAHLDMEIRATYRRLVESVSGSSFKRRVSWLLASMRQSNVKRRNREFSRVFASELDEEKSRVMRLFGGKTCSLAASLKKAFYPKRWRPSISSELSIRFLMLIGKV